MSNDLANNGRSSVIGSKRVGFTFLAPAALSQPYPFRSLFESIRDVMSILSIWNCRSILSIWNCRRVLSI